MTNMVLGDTKLASLTPSVNAPLLLLIITTTFVIGLARVNQPFTFTFFSEASKGPYQA
jgi:hypothetical protein